MPDTRQGLACAGVDTSLGLRFVQERLGLVGKTVFLLSGGFYVFGNLPIVLSGAVPLVPFLLHGGSIIHLAATAVMGVLWALARWRCWSRSTLGALDALSLILSCTAWGLLVLGGEAEGLFVAMLATTVTVVARAILVPSSGARTFWLTTIACVPLFVIALIFAKPPTPNTEFHFSRALLDFMTVLSTGLWIGCAVALATVASRTIYGLRKQVNEATDIGQYTLETKIGSGGMGEVWRARHRLLIRPAAVKLVRPGTLGSTPGDPDVLLRRFEREARATAALRSPHTVQLYDFGVTEDGTLYYVMELLDGLDLDSLVKRFGPVPAERAIHILEQVCASLADAHENGLVHRDIKPANIVVSRVGAAWDFVKVLDFGLVKLEGAQQSDESIKLTAAGAVSGTPAFIAPEVAVGDATTDHRVDLYSLGCVAYWLVTGTLVFDGPTAMKVMYAHANIAPAPPSSRVELPIPAPLEALILECLEKDPARRPPSAASLQERLRAMAAASPWSAERAQRWWSAHAPSAGDSRPAADILLSHEARPMRVIRHLRN